MAKRIALVFLACLIVGALGGFASAADKTIRLLWWQQPSKEVEEAWKSEWARFESATGIKVEIESLGWDDMFKKMAIAFTGKSSDYDVIYLDPRWLSTFGARGFLEPMGKLRELGMDKYFIQGWQKDCMVNGKIYMVPKTSGPRVMYYNKKLLATAGVAKPPANWDELLNACRKVVSTAKTYGFAVPLNGSMAFKMYVIFMAGAGGQMFDENGNCVINSTANVKALTFLNQMVQEKLIPEVGVTWTSSRMSNTFFANGEVAFTFSLPELYGWSNDPSRSKIVGDAGIAIIPGDGVATKSATRGAIEGLAIPVFSKKKDLAWKFIRWAATDRQHAINIFKGVGYLPVLKQFYDDPQVTSMSPVISVVHEQMKYPGPNFENTPYAAEINDAMRVELQSVFLRVKNPQQALDDAVKKINQIVGK